MHWFLRLTLLRRNIYFEGMCYGSAVRSAYPRARVLYIDKRDAEALPGVVCVLTAEDIPGQVDVGHIQKDQPTMVPVGSWASPRDGQ